MRSISGAALMIGLVFSLFFLEACIVVSPEPGYEPGPPPDHPGYSASQIRDIARKAVIDDLVYRHGYDSRPRIGSASVRPYDQNESRVHGRVSYNTPRGRIYVNFDCLVHRFSGHVRNLRYF